MKFLPFGIVEITRAGGPWNRKILPEWWASRGPEWRPKAGTYNFPENFPISRAVGPCNLHSQHSASLALIPPRGELTTTGGIGKFHRGWSTILNDGNGKFLAGGLLF